MLYSSLTYLSFFAKYKNNMRCRIGVLIIGAFQFNRLLVKL